MLCIRCNSGNLLNNDFGQDTYEIAIPGPPQFTLNGSVITDGATQTVFAGQRVSLSIAAPAGYSLASQTWSISNSSDAIGGYTASAAYGAVNAMPSLTQDAISFYFVNVNQTTETVKCHYVLQNGDPNGAAVTVTFNVQGPTGVSINAIQLTGVNIISPPILFGTKTLNYPILQDGRPGYAGIKFSAQSASLPALGIYQWVQLINHDNTSFITSVGRFINEPNISGNPELDGSYPYFVTYTASAPNYTAADSPYMLLTPDYGEHERSFQATMNLMWDPMLPAGCSPATPNST